VVETAIGGFTIERELARGGMGVVYVAWQARPRRRVALKVIAPEVASDLRFRERFVRESDMAASTEHPNIVPVYAAGEDDGRLFLAMRLVDGQDLRRLLTENGPSPHRRPSTSSLRSPTRSTRRTPAG
jgi:serine/threonine protein kinase